MSGVEVHCRTNLDPWHAERWPDSLAARPMKGDRIQSLWQTGDGSDRGRGFRLELEVVSIVLHEHRIEVELHMPSWMSNMSIRDFEKWYKRARDLPGAEP